MLQYFINGKQVDRPTAAWQAMVVGVVLSSVDFDAYRNRPAEATHGGGITVKWVQP